MALLNLKQTSRQYRRWSQVGVSQPIQTALMTFNARQQTISDASRPNDPYRSGHAREAGSSMAELVEALSDFAGTRPRKDQSIVLAGVCRLLKEQYFVSLCVFFY